jgi:hypothetical protein
MFGSEKEESVLLFGDYDLKYAKPGSNLTWNPLI